MNRQEQKQALKDILADINDIKELIEDKKEYMNNILNKIDDLDNELSEFTEVYNWDASELKNNTIQAFIESIDIESVHENLTDFQSELEEHMDELSDVNREKLEERYTDLETAIECFDMSDCEDLDMINDRIDDIVNYLKGML
jgi:predicted  nucleic acid-binding Zn-ribbon protein